MEEKKIDWVKLEKKLRYYLTTKWSEKHQRWLAAISLGHARKGDRATYLCTISLQDTPVECEKWYQDQMLTKEWKREENSKEVKIHKFTKKEIEGHGKPQA